MIYVHVPFCRSFCTYCDFYSEIACRGKDAGAVEAYVSALLEEISSRREEILGTLDVNTLYIGGGTPSVLPPDALRRIVEALPGAPFDEFTIEVNPEDIVQAGPEYVRALKALGVNRVSMGVQSLDDGMLRWMNRRHSADGARQAFRILRECGIGNISVDVITGVPGMSLEMLRSTVQEILEWRPEHISAYQLSIEEGSALAGLIEEGKCAEAPEEDCRAQYEYMCRTLSEAGYRHYEISNWALPGHEARHNSAYWTRAPYVGLGPGAHSLSADGLTRSWNSQQLTGWTRGSEKLGAEEVREEQIMLGLRTAAGWNGKVIPEADWFIADEIISLYL